MGLCIRMLFLVLFFCSSCSKNENKIKDVDSFKNKKILVYNDQIEKKIIKSDATYLSLTGDVLHKRSKEVVWKQSVQNTGLFLKDWVKTGVESTASINMSKNRIINMFENSRIILLDKQDKGRVRRAIIGVSKGDVGGEIEGEVGIDSEIIVRLPHAWLRVKSSLKQGVKKIFRISLTNNKMKIHAKKGDIEVLTKGKVIKIAESKIYQKVIKEDLSLESFDFNKQTDPPSELKEKSRVKNKEIKKHTVKNFMIKYPKDGSVINRGDIEVMGVVPSKQELIYKGQQVKVVNNKFKFKIKLEMGVNILTFQIISGTKVKYKTIELERK